MAVWDELLIKYLTLTGGGLDYQVPVEAMEQWSTAATPSPRYPFSLTFKFDDQSRFGLSAVRPTSFIASLDEQHWNRYLASLERLPSARVLYQRG